MVSSHAKFEWRVLSIVVDPAPTGGRNINKNEDNDIHAAIPVGEDEGVSYLVNAKFHSQRRATCQNTSFNWDTVRWKELIHSLL